MSLHLAVMKCLCLCLHIMLLWQLFLFVLFFLTVVFYNPFLFSKWSFLRLVMYFPQLSQPHSLLLLLFSTTIFPPETHSYTYLHTWSTHTYFAVKYKFQKDTYQRVMNKAILYLIIRCTNTHKRWLKHKNTSCFLFMIEAVCQGAPETLTQLKRMRGRRALLNSN